MLGGKPHQTPDGDAGGQGKAIVSLLVLVLFMWLAVAVAVPVAETSTTKYPVVDGINTITTKLIVPHAPPSTAMNTTYAGPRVVVGGRFFALP